MSIVKWDQTGEKLYKTGVDHGVLYKRNNKGEYPNGVPWNGLVTVTESPEGAESSPLYADNIKYLNLISAENFKYSIEAYMYPPEFAECDGSKEIAPGVFATGQARSHFGLTYRTLLGNDIEGTEHGYELHIIYDSTAAPSEKGNNTVNDSPEATNMSWACDTTPVECPGCKPTAHFYLDSTKVDKDALTKLEAILYGTDGADGAGGTEPRLPLPSEIVEIFKATTPTEPTGSDA